MSKEYALCAHLEELRALSHDELKWHEGSPFRKVGTFDDLEPKARSIVRATLRAYPTQILKKAVFDSGIQLLRFRAGDGLSPAFAKFVGHHIGVLFGAEVGNTFNQSRQAHGQLPIAGARILHLAGLLLGGVFCFCTIVVWRSRLPKPLLAFYTVVLAELCGAQ